MAEMTPEKTMLRLAGIVEESIVDGPGLRLAIFTQGCPHHCKGCHNPQTHAFEGGFLRSIKSIAGIYAENPLLSGITFSGGEPFMQAAALAALGREIHSMGGNVITYTGFCLEDLLTQDMLARTGVKELLQETDWLVDGPYIEELRNLELQFRGSANQRLLTRQDMRDIAEKATRVEGREIFGE